MEESARQKLRAFPSSMFSCSSRTLTDVVDKSILLHKSNSFHRFPSLCRPVTPLGPTSRSGPVPIPKVPEGSTPAAGFTLADVLKGRACPPAATADSPLNHPFRKLDSKKSHSKGQPAVEDNQWYSTDDEREEEEEEDETDTIFSSRSLSFSSSDSSRQRQSPCRRRRRRRRRSNLLPEVGFLPMDNDDEGPNIKGSFAVVKKSSDPYGDFRRSMVEMIVEKQIFGHKELERLLHCFLSLNSHHHHRVIVEVFTEIWEALFPHWS